MNRLHAIEPLELEDLTELLAVGTRAESFSLLTDNGLHPSARRKCSRLAIALLLHCPMGRKESMDLFL